LICLWTYGSSSSNNLYGGADAEICDHGYDSIPKVITSAKGQVFSSTQGEMIAIENALDFTASHYHACPILIYSYSLRSLTQIASSFWKSSMSDTKLRLLRTFRRALQVSTIKLVHIPGYS